ncbi:4Fe-4S dicluster domain-containing protein [Chloroflexota bacterium]
MKLIEIVPTNCTGCRLCELVCSVAHEGECSTAKSRIKILRDEEFGNNLVSICLQCAEPYCVDACTYGVLSRDEKTGVITVDDDLCTGCGDCFTACPVDALALDEDKNIAFKCDLCGGNPECVQICPREVLVLKEIDPASETRKSFLEETSQLIGQRQIRI